MKYVLKRHPRRPIIIEGFPGYGLVGSIATTYLIDHLDMEPIGSFYTDKVPAVATIHKSRLMSPFGLYYSKDLNLLVANIIVASKEVEWPYANSMIKLASELNAKRIISIEGVNSPNPQGRVYVYTNSKDELEQLRKKGMNIMQEAMIVGPTAALMLLSHNTPIIGFFAETNIGIPDSRAAAEAIKAIDKYLGLKIDYKPLLKQAEIFEKSLREFIDKASRAQEEKEKKRLDYFG
ncbi:proteasome assembly chaperone family protein [Candidatus Woesearchaeota archaeon]|nr:proteasome assembly chaperone family protein [Candidatus Woesearchaeota archaeon]